MTRNPDAPKKRHSIIESYPHLTHLAGEGGGPLCKANGVNAKNIVKEDATCRSCNKRSKR